MAEWSDFIVRAGHIVEVARREVASIDDVGLFRICGLPPVGAIKFTARLKGFYPIETELVLGNDGVLLHDIQLVPLTSTRGTAAIIVRVIDPVQSRPLVGTVSIPELHIAVDVSGASDTLKNLPVGSWTLHVRSLGYEPVTIFVNAHNLELADSVVTVPLVALAQTLAAVHTYGVVSRGDQRIIDGINERMRSTSGTLIRAGDPFLASATEASDALRAGRGFIVRSPTEVETNRGFACKSAKTNLDVRRYGARELAVYLDGQRILGGLETLNNMVRPHEILAVEAYPEVLSAPFLWRTADACGVVAFWTKH